MKKTVLIADDDADVVDLLTRHCRALGLNVDSASNAMTALGKAEEMLPDAVILDVDMPYGNGLTVCEMMAHHEGLRGIPVLIVTGNSNEEIMRRCHQLCAYYVLKSPDLWSRVEPVLRDLFDLREVAVPCPTVGLPIESSAGAARGPTNPFDAVFTILGVEIGGSPLEDDLSDKNVRSEQPWVLLIEDDDDVALALRLRLNDYGAQLVRAATGTEGYRRAFMEAPRAIILDYELPQGNGDYVLRRLNESDATRNIPVIVLTGCKGAGIERRMRNLGASEFLTKPIDWARLRQALNLSLDPGKTTDRSSSQQIPT